MKTYIPMSSATATERKSNIYEKKVRIKNLYFFLIL